VKKYLTLTNLLIFVNIAIFSILFLINHHSFAIDGNLLVKYGAINSDKIVLYDEWWRLIAAMFLHLDIFHLSMNMVSLYIIGTIVEQAYSRFIYLLTYFITGISGSLLSLYISPYFLLVGASGAIFGLFGLLAGYYAVQRNIPSISNQSAISNFWIIIILNIFIGFTMPIVVISSHISGVLSGFIGGYLISKYSKNGVVIYIFLFAIYTIYLYIQIKISSF
jgi:rhomboid protease GluP